MPMGIAQEKAKGQLHQLQDPSNLGKSHYNIINVEAGAIHTRGLTRAAPPPEKEKGPETPKQN